MNEDQLLAYVRVCVPLDSVSAFLNEIIIIMLIAAPVYLLIAVFGGLYIARKALTPISEITKTAAEIEQGDLSLRIKGINTKDEVGHLANTFNSMLEHLEKSFQRERQFSSDASHELRTPVSIIMAYSEALIAKMQNQKENMNDEQLESLELIHTESEKMNVIISQLLMLARGYEGKYPKEIESIDLNEVIINVIEQMQELADRSDITLLYSPDGDLNIMADQSLITQMLINLVENGIKYGKPGGYVRLMAKKEIDGMHITVEDNGIGISETDLPNIFERFYRADKSRDRSGTGLGLSIIKWIVNEHNGKILVSSELDKGTIFSIII